MLETEIDSVDLAADRKATINAELEASRERQHTLKEQIERLRTQLESSRKSIGLSDSHFRSAISCSLELMGADTLKPVQGEEAVSRFQFPALNERTGADPSWAETMDTLRVPRKRDQKLWDWRRSSPIRSVVFEDPGTLDDEVVHMHLEQRVVQRLLGRFTAQGFIHHDLSRACLAQATDSIPRVVLLGRLCLYGSGAARLHEELIHVTARWVDPQIRKEPLVPYAREAELKTLSLLDDVVMSTVMMRNQSYPHAERPKRKRCERFWKLNRSTSQMKSAGWRKSILNKNSSISATTKMSWHNSTQTNATGLSDWSKFTTS